MSKRYPQEVREEVLKKIRNGQKVSEVAKLHGINDMTIRTWLLFLIGNRQAILELAADRRALWVGLLFVLSAGFAREYDARSSL